MNWYRLGSKQLCIILLTNCYGNVGKQNVGTLHNTVFSIQVDRCLGTDSNTGSAYDGHITTQPCLVLNECTTSVPSHLEEIFWY
jgi:hypothetical protein